MLLSQPRCYMSLLALSLLLIVPMAIGSNFVFHLFILACSYAALASAWNIVGGFAGQLSLGHAAFYGVGAYTSTLLMMHFGVSPWLGMFAGALLSTLLAVLVSWPCFRLRGPFFALATISVLEVIRLLAINQQDFTGGATGLAVPLQLCLKWMLFRERWPYLLIAFALPLLLLLSTSLRSEDGAFTLSGYASFLSDGYSAVVVYLIERCLNEVAGPIAAAHGCSAEVYFERRYPALINSRAETEFCLDVMRDVVGEKNTHVVDPVMASEDFAFFLQEKPGCYVFLGAGEGEHRHAGHGLGPCALHNGSYDFNDNLIPVGASYWIRLVQRYLA